mmetsp:Transcript_34301/g.107173  ORF Transcript_34301/g.107173 Transcript_34301/m.107173 type:complete len:217 (-) Transcript_34301:416-1066(-)
MTGLAAACGLGVTGTVALWILGSKGSNILRLPVEMGALDGAPAALLVPRAWKMPKAEDEVAPPAVASAGTRGGRGWGSVGTAGAAGLGAEVADDRAADTGGPGAEGPRGDADGASAGGACAGTVIVAVGGGGGEATAVRPASGFSGWGGCAAGCRPESKCAVCHMSAWLGGRPEAVLLRKGLLRPRRALSTDLSYVKTEGCAGTAAFSVVLKGPRR